MSKITRKLMKIFGLNAGPTQLSQWGSLAAGTLNFTSDPAVIQGLANWLQGWYGGVVGVNSPAIEDMNAAMYVFAYQLAYGFQAGVAEWDASTTYYIGSIANDGLGNLYISIADDNTGNALTDATKWKTSVPLQVAQGQSNLGLATSVGSSALTISLKDAQGNAPSSGSPVVVTMANPGNSKLSNVRSITSATSLVISSGSTLGQVSGVDQFIYVYLVENSASPGTFQLAVSGQTIFENVAVTTTAEGGAGGADSGSTMYSTSVITGYAKLIARLTSNQTTAGTWTVAPSVALMYPTISPPPNSSVWLYTGNGWGSTNTVIRRYSNSIIVGSDITYADSATLGASLTINKSGVYTMSYQDGQVSTGISTMGASVNSAALSTAITGILPTNGGLGYYTLGQTSGLGAGATSAFFNAGDIVRPHGAGDSDAASTAVARFKIVRVS